MQAILSDDEVLVQPVQPRRIAKLLSHLTDPNNDATPKLRSHKALTASTTTNPAISAHSGKCAVDGHAIVDDSDLQSDHADDREPICREVTKLMVCLFITFSASSALIGLFLPYFPERNDSVAALSCRIWTQIMQTTRGLKPVV